MRPFILLVVLALSSSAVAQSGPATWRFGGRQLWLGQGSSTVTMAATCSGSGVELTLAYPADYPGGYQAGTSATIAIAAAGLAPATVDGTLVDNEDQDNWLLRASIDLRHPLMEALHAGRPVTLSAVGRSYSINPSSGRAAIASFGSACGR